MLDLEDARPDAARDRHLRMSMDAKLLRSLIYLLETAQGSLRRDYPNTKERLLHLLRSVEDGEGKLRGTAFAIHQQLLLAMRNGNAALADKLLTYVATADWVGRTPKVLPLWSSAFTAVEGSAFVMTVSDDYESTYSRPLDLTSPDESQIVAMKEILEMTLDRLSKEDPETMREVEALISDFVIVQSRQTNAGTCFNAFGMVYLRVLTEAQEWTTYLESIVHEAAHHHLYALCTAHSILESEGERLYRSPIRSEPRPMSGVFHAMFVLARTIRCLNIFRANPRFVAEIERLPTSYNQANNPAPLEEQFLDAYTTVRENARLTALGARLVESCREIALSH